MEGINNIRIKEDKETGAFELIAPDGTVLDTFFDIEVARMVAGWNVSYLDKIILPAANAAAQETVEKELSRVGTSYDGIYTNEGSGIVFVDIAWGDWKHDHGYMDYLMQTRFNLQRLSVNITEEDGGDCYSATHAYGLVPQ